MRSSFSVEYEHPEHPDNYCASDWNHWEKGSWIRSWKSITGSGWHREKDNGGKLDKLACEAILVKFGLWEWRDELPMEKVQYMSPASLVRFRRENGLHHMAILSDTPGDRSACAEDYE